MTLTRLSLFYLATYLPVAGLLLLLVPDTATRLLLSNAVYDDVFTRLAGAVLLAIGVLIIGIVYHRVEVLYVWTLGIRLFLVTVLFVLYLRDIGPFFLVIFAIVGFGVALTAGGYVLDRRAGRVATA